MAGNPYFQDTDPAVAPDPVTPADAPSDARGWAMVTPHGVSTAPYDISAPQDIAGITAATEAAGRLTGAGVVYPRGPRQAQADAILGSPQGAGAMDVQSGFYGMDVNPGANLETPDQGHGMHPGTTQEGVPQFTAGLGMNLPGVTPEHGSMAATAGGDYPGTVQDGLTMYGTS